MTKFEIKISYGSKLIKEISCDEFGNSNITETLKSIRSLKEANEEFLRQLVAKEKTSSINSSTSGAEHNSDDEEDLMGADDEDDEEENDIPSKKKRKTEE